MSAPPENAPREVREPSYLDAIIPLVTLVVLIGGAVLLFGAGAVDGPIPVALIVCGMVAAVIALKDGYSWEDIDRTGRIAFESIVTPVFILLAAGALIGTWNMSGTIPTLIHYGIKLLHPSYFYIAALMLCAITSLAVGSAWTIAGTIGVGLVGLASLVGVSPAITAGAAVSGAYLGDKFSPLSETTVLTANLAGIDEYAHLRAIVWTSGPSFIIAAVLFAVLGLRASGGVGVVDTDSELTKIDQLFWITPLNLVPLAALIVLSIRKVPASLAIMGCALLAGAMAPFLQRPAVARFIHVHAIPEPMASLKAVWLAMATGYAAKSGLPVLDSLLSRGGMQSMLATLWIIIGAVTFGTVLEEFKLLAKLIDPLVRRARSTGRLLGSVVATAVGLNILAGDQYIAVVLPARLFRAEFAKRGLSPSNLSRACADGGTVTSALVPWNSSGAYLAATLGVSTFAYLPFCFFNIVTPLLSVLWGITGFKIKRITDDAPIARPHSGREGPHSGRERHT